MFLFKYESYHFLNRLKRYYSTPSRERLIVKQKPTIRSLQCLLKALYKISNKFHWLNYNKDLLLPLLYLLLDFIQRFLIGKSVWWSDEDKVIPIDCAEFTNAFVAEMRIIVKNKPFFTAMDQDKIDRMITALEKDVPKILYLLCDGCSSDRLDPLGKVLTDPEKPIITFLFDLKHFGTLKKDIHPDIKKRGFK